MKLKFDMLCTRVFTHESMTLIPGLPQSTTLCFDTDMVVFVTSCGAVFELFSQQTV